MYKQSTSEPSNQKSPFVELEIPGQEKVMIRKRTAVWLFQDTERLSADRLFRVRANQPFSNKPKQEHTNLSVNDATPVSAKYVIIGDLCTFCTKSEGQVTIGRVMQLIKYDKNQKELQYKGNYIATSEKNKYGVLCTWYKMSKKPHTYEICTTLDATYYPLCSYLCKLTAGCLVNPNPSTKPIACTSSIVSVKESFILTAECYEHILHLQMKIDFTEPITIPPEHPEEKKKERSKRWVKCGQITLYQNERNVVVI